jgi:hypothetical protein
MIKLSSSSRVGTRGPAPTTAPATGRPPRCCAGLWNCPGEMRPGSGKAVPRPLHAVERPFGCHEGRPLECPRGGQCDESERIGIHLRANCVGSHALPRLRVARQRAASLAQAASARHHSLRALRRAIDPAGVAYPGQGVVREPAHSPADTIAPHTTSLAGSRAAGGGETGSPNDSV